MLKPLMYMSTKKIIKILSERNARSESGIIRSYSQDTNNPTRGFVCSVRGQCCRDYESAMHRKVNSEDLALL